jgi:hypothetical protein
MSSHENSTKTGPPLDLSTWKMLPNLLIAVGGIGAVAGYFSDPRQFGFSWLLAYMFFLALCLGGLGFTILHHLFDASWSVPIRRIFEQLAVLLFPTMLVLFLPIVFLAPKLFEWMQKINNHTVDHPIAAKYPLFTYPGFYLVSLFCFLVWAWLSRGLRGWSLKQDETGSVLCTRKLRRYAAGGVFFFAVSLTLAAIMWMKALQHEWFSTMYGVYYFAGAMWTTIATVYVITRLLERQGPLRGLVHEKTYYFIGSILFAFTVFYAYVTFAQYFIIWNANVPEETFWYTLREKGTWWNVGMLIIFGHFFLPFLMLLRIDWKLKLTVMVPLFIWAWLMEFVDLSFNISPVARAEGPWLHWMDLACMAFIGGILCKVYLMNLFASPIVPQKDPRFAESQDIYVPSASSGVNPESTGGGH